LHLGVFLVLGQNRQPRCAVEREPWRRIGLAGEPEHVSAQTAAPVCKSESGTTARSRVVTLGCLASRPNLGNLGSVKASAEAISP